MKKQNLVSENDPEFLSTPLEETEKQKPLRPLSEHPVSEQEIMAELQQKVAPKSRLKSALSWIILLVLAGISIWIISGLANTFGDDNISFGDLWAQLRPDYLWLAVFFFLFALFLDSAKFSFILKITTKKARPILSFKVAHLGRYYDGVTPLATGGQPFQMYYMAKRGVPAGVASAIPLIKYFVQMFTWLIVCGFLFAFNHTALRTITNHTLRVTITTAAYTGLALNSIMPLALIVMSLLPTFGRRLASMIIRIGFKLKLVKDFDQTMEKAISLVDEFKGCIRFMATKIIHLFLLALICALELIVSYSIPFCLCVSLGNMTPSAELWYDTLTLTCYSYYASSFIPTPGGTAAAETSIMMVFSGLAMASGTRSWMAIFWRFLNFYIFIIIGLMIVFYDSLKKKVQEKGILKKRHDKIRRELISQLDSPDPNERLACLRVLKSLEKHQKTYIPKRRPYDFKLSLRSCWSDSNLTPSALAFKSYESGAEVAGLADNGTLGGLPEFLQASRILGLTPLCGVRVRVRPPAQLCRNQRYNDPLQKDHLRLNLYAFSEAQIPEIRARLETRRPAALKRVEDMTQVLNIQLEPLGLKLNFEEQILPKVPEDGSLSERHILLALAEELIERYSKGPTLLSRLQTDFELSLPKELSDSLLNVTGNPRYLDDLVLALTPMIRTFYIDAQAECFSLQDLSLLAADTGAILVYPYYGDVEKQQNDKVYTEKFEDDILPELLDTLCAYGVQAVSYNPFRLKPAQMENISALCTDRGLLELPAGVILSKYQTFSGSELPPEKYPKLYEDIWAAVGNSVASSPDESLFSPQSKEKLPLLSDRTAVFASRGRKTSSDFIRATSAEKKTKTDV